MGIRFYTLLVLLITLTVCGCTKRGDIPSYIKIEKIDLQDNPNLEEGALSQNIVDAWVIVNGSMLGAFELPCTIPVLADGDAEIEVFAGVKMNGISNTRIIYPFYDSYNENISLTKEEITTVNPVVMYVDNIDLVLNEDFESSMIQFETTQLSDTGFVLELEDKNPDFGGISCGKAVLDNDQTFFEVVTTENYEFMTTRQVFAEIDFKTDIPVKVGLQVHNPGGSSYNAGIVNFNTTDTWKKIYVNITPTINSNTNADDYSFFISCLKSEDSQETNTALIDNVKIIQYLDNTTDEQ